MDIGWAYLFGLPRWIQIIVMWPLGGAFAYLAVTPPRVLWILVPAVGLVVLPFVPWPKAREADAEDR